MKRAFLASVLLAGCSAEPAITIDQSGQYAADVHVQSTPSGIDCGGGASACTAEFSSGTTVHLTWTQGSGVPATWFCGIPDCPSTTSSGCDVPMNADVTLLVGCT